MLLLGIETATRRVGVALGSDEGMLGIVEVGGATGAGPPRHAEQLAPAIDFLCREVGVSLRSVSAVAVGIGPGMFTGLRVGVTTAKTLGMALSVPLVPVPSLDLLAYPLRHATHELVVPMIYARRHEVYYAIYQPVPGGTQRVSEYSPATPEQIVAEISARGQHALCCGDGAMRFSSSFGGRDLVELAGPAHSRPDLGALLELAGARFAREEFVGANDVAPLYLRKSDAELDADRRAS